MFNLYMALASFWQLARHWKQGEAAALDMSCEAGSLNIQQNAKLGHPDLLHFHHPSAPPCKGKSPSQLRQQERRRPAAKTNVEEAKLTQNFNADDIAPKLLPSYNVERHLESPEVFISLNILVLS